HWKIHKKDCNCYRIIDEPELGKGFVATREIKAGSIILDELPVVFAPSWDTPSCITCGVTLPRTVKYQRCPKCTWPICSLECAKVEIHAENECKLFTSKSFGFALSFIPNRSILPNFTKLIRACCLKMKRPDVYQQMTEVCSDFSVPVVDGPRQEQLEEMMPHLKALGLDLKHAEIKK
ncbi:unnamed protein product, partial [Allacma fusca]